MKKKQIFWLALEVIIGLLIAYIIGTWIKGQPFMNATLRAGQMQFGQYDGNIVLGSYCGILLMIVVSGFLLARKIEKENE